MHKNSRDITYAGSARTAAGRAVVRMLENTTGRRRLMRRTEGYVRQVAEGHGFWPLMIDRFGLDVRFVGGGPENIPAEGPLVVIANHPYGILDGLVMGHILNRARGDFRILANSVFNGSAELDRVVLPIDFGADRESLSRNLQTRRDALAYLTRGGAIGVFPGGTVSTGASPFSRPLDPRWRRFTARMVARSGATVVPVFFDGHTSRLFQIASHVHQTLRLGLLIHEFQRRVDTPVRVVVGRPLAPSALRQSAKDPVAMMDFLRKSTYALSPTPLDADEYGFDFEDRHRG